MLNEAVVSKNSGGGTEENHVKLESGQSSSSLTSRISRSGILSALTFDDRHCLSAVSSFYANET
jgi:hypothetical protein